MKRRGFTVVELLIVIVVIAVLAAITIVAFNGIQSRATAAALSSDLAAAAKKLELAKIDSSTSSYPTTFPSGVTASSNVGLSLSEAGTGFCINAQSLTGNTIIQSYKTSSGVIQDGTCPGAVLPRSEIGMNPNQVNDTGFSNVTTGANGWFHSRGSGGAIAGTTRDGTVGDPFPNRKVLRISNTASGVNSWSYVSGAVNWAGVSTGNSYTTRYWVRLASGTFTGPPNHFGVQHSSATNTSIPINSGSGTITGTWQKVERTVTSIANGLNGNIIYLNLNGADAQLNTYVLEYQGFEIVLN